MNVIAVPIGKCQGEVDGQWRLYYNGWALNPKAKNAIGAEYAIGLALANRQGSQ